MRQSRFITYLLVIFMAFSLTSCINFIEKISMKKDGSGTYSLILDMSKVGNMIKMMGQGDDEGEMKEAFSKVDSTFESRKEKLEAIKGISNARIDMNEKTFQMTMSYDFTDVDALNKSLSGEDYKEGDDYENYFVFNKKTLERSDVESFSKLLNDGMRDEELEFDPSVFLSDAYYKLILEFDSKIKKFSNDQYTEVGDNSISWKKYMFDSRDEDKNIKVSVKLK